MSDAERIARLEEQLLRIQQALAHNTTILINLYGVALYLRVKAVDRRDSEELSEYCDSIYSSLKNLLEIREAMLND